MITLNSEARAALTSGHLAHLVTLNADGSPQVAIVWVGLDGDEIVSAHLSGDQRKLQRSPRHESRVVTRDRWSQRVRSGQLPGSPRTSTRRARRRSRTATAAGPRLSRAGREVPAHGRSAARLHHADNPRAVGGGRSLAIAVNPTHGHSTIPESTAIDNLRVVAKAYLVERQCTLDPLRLTEACEALRSAVDS